jgi:hypothetical protein
VDHTAQRLIGLQQDHSLRFTGPAFAYRADPFRSFELYAHEVGWEIYGCSQARPNFRAVILQLGTFKNDRGVNINQLIALRCREAQCVLEKLEAIGVFPLDSRVREVHSDIAEGQSTQNGVGHGMKQDIGIRVASQAELTGNLDSTEYERAASLNPVRVPTLADPEWRKISLLHLKT